jgi:transcriptional regulator with XRE-family HTH domain
MRSSVLQDLLDETPKDLRLMLKMQAQISLRVKELMREAGMSQKELAQKMEKTPAELNKWLRPGHNMTLRSISKLELALGKIILEVPKKRPFEASADFEIKRKTRFFVAKHTLQSPNSSEYLFLETEVKQSLNIRIA